MRVTIDESMIKYMGRAVVSFVQYMPAEPIKQGIKVFCVCCAYTAYFYSRLRSISLGKDNEAAADNGGAAEAVVDRLITNANLTQARGRILYTILTIGTWHLAHIH
eukprot:scaffold2974_cov288-Chaetoceros_neogracile.AAC.16